MTGFASTVTKGLKTSAGPHGDGRFETVGDLIRHIFAAEKRNIDRLSDRALTDPASIPNDNIEALFKFSQQSRKDLKEFVTSRPSQTTGEGESHHPWSADSIFAIGTIRFSSVGTSDTCR
jgi:hypothetical protein